MYPLPNTKADPVTTRELAVLIRELIRCEINRKMYSQKSDDELSEILVRAIADAFKFHSAAQGVFADPKQ